MTAIDLIHEAAARWTVLLDGGTLSPSDWQELETWLAADPEHRLAFEQHQQSWNAAAPALRELATYSPVAALAHPPRKRSRLLTQWTLAAASFAVLLFLGGTYYISSQPRTELVATAPLQRSSLTLPDGSRVELNAQTTVLTDFVNGRRRIRLDKGEALFSVAKDPAHPFTVETPSGTVQVTGTVFNVRLALNGRPEVTLLEGGVVFKKDDGEIRLNPGQQLSVAGAVQTLSERELESVTGWREGKIFLTGMTLAAAAERFASYHGKSITVSPEIVDLQLGGTYALDNLKGFFDLLEEDTLSLRAVNRGDGSYAIVSR